MTADLEVVLDESRYDRQERITWWDQSLLADSTALVIGAGALGNEIVKNLVLVGVGSIVVLDFDRVELSNLSRCVLLRPDDEGDNKATALARRAEDLGGQAEVTGIAGDLREFGAGLFLRADVVIGGLDNREARLYMNRLAWRAGVPWIDGAIEALAGVARVFRPPQSCYECTLSALDFEVLSHRQSCRLLSRDDLEAGKVPTTATTASVVGALQAQEAVKQLHGDRPGIVGLDGAYVLDGANNDTYTLEYPFSEDCLAHHVFEDPIAIEVGSEPPTFDSIAGAVSDDADAIELGDDYLTAWRCTECDSTESAAGPVGLALFADAECPACGTGRQPVTVSTIEVGSDLAASSIDAVGLRRDELLAVRSGLEYAYVWVRDADERLPEGWR